MEDLTWLKDVVLLLAGGSVGVKVFIETRSRRNGGSVATRKDLDRVHERIDSLDNKIERNHGQVLDLCRQTCSDVARLEGKIGE